MQNKCLERFNYDTRIYNNPTELLMALKEHALNHQETKYKMSILTDAVKAVYNTKQKGSKSLQNYTRKIKTARAIFELHLSCLLIFQKN